MIIIVIIVIIIRGRPNFDTHIHLKKKGNSVTRHLQC